MDHDFSGKPKALTALLRMAAPRAGLVGAVPTTEDRPQDLLTGDTHDQDFSAELCPRVARLRDLCAQGIRREARDLGRTHEGPRGAPPTPAPSASGSST